MYQQLNDARGAIATIPNSLESTDTELSALMNALPHHRCSLSICHNEHKDSGMPVAEWAEVGNLKFASADDKQRAIENDELWTMHWYPETSHRFDTISASTLPALLDAVRDADIQAA